MDYLMIPLRPKRDFTTASYPLDRYFRMLVWIPAARKRGLHRKGRIVILINFPKFLSLDAPATTLFQPLGSIRLNQKSKAAKMFASSLTSSLLMLRIPQALWV